MHVQTALAYAQRGWHVFPLHGIVKGRCTCGRRDCSSPGKHPLVRRGLHEATTDLDMIEEWWSRWPLANIGIATGAKSGIVVIDIDVPRALDSLDKLVHKLPGTLTGLTGGGGLHLIYRGNCEHLRCTTAYLPGIGRLDGIDVRANGGYIVTRRACIEAERATNGSTRTARSCRRPEWLKQPPRPSRAITPSASRFTAGTGTAYDLAVLRNQLEILGAAQEGERNHALNRCASS